MRNRDVSTAVVLDLPAGEFERARRLTMISLGVWICIGVLAALNGSPFA